ncbi:MAG: MBL fold metallo-hydrolase [Verrucomicrobiales bacterium]
MVEVSVLGSGSSGNCALVRSGGTALLIDAGLSARQICRRLELHGIDPDDLAGIVLTHEHGDHTQGIDVFCRKRRVPVYSTRMTREIVGEGMRSDVDWRLFEGGQEFALGEFSLQSFPVPHDAVDPHGFRISDGDCSLGVLSDVGHITNLVRDCLRGADILFVEANYDETLLQNDTRRPWPTKQRILSRHGHLSNTQAAQLVAEVASEALRRVILGHLSEDCNQPSLACGVVRDRLRAEGFHSVEVSCAAQHEPTPLFRAEGRSVETGRRPPEHCDQRRAPAASLDSREQDVLF